MRKDLILKFEHFLLNEDATYLAGRMGDILDALQDIQKNAKGMGTRQLVRNSERVVNQCRRILHTNWGNDNIKNLEALQRVAVAIKKGIEEKDDIENIINNSVSEISDTLADMGVPVNSLGGDKQQGGEEKESADQTSPPKGQEEEKKNKQPQEPQPEQAPGGMGQQMPGGMGPADAMGGMGGGMPGAMPGGSPGAMPGM